MKIVLNFYFVIIYLLKNKIALCLFLSQVIINFFLILVIFCLIIITLLLFLKKSCFFLNYQKELFFYFRQWYIFYYSRWFLFFRSRIVTAKKGHSVLKEFYLICETTNFDYCLRMKQLFINSIIKNMDHFHFINNFLSLKTIPSMSISRLGNSRELYLSSKMFNIFVNYQFGFENKLFFSERLFSQKAIYNLTNVEKTRLVESYKDLKTEELINNLCNSCDKLGEFGANIKTKLLTARELDKTNKQIGIKVDEQHLLDKVRNIVIQGSNLMEEKVLAEELIKIEFKVYDLQKLVIDFYKENIVKNVQVQDVDQILKFDQIQNKIVALENPDVLHFLMLKKTVETEKIITDDTLSKKEEDLIKISNQQIKKHSFKELLKIFKNKIKNRPIIIKPKEIQHVEDSNKSAIKELDDENTDSDKEVLHTKEYFFQISFLVLIYHFNKLSKKKNRLLFRSFLKKRKDKKTKKYLRFRFFQFSPIVKQDLKNFSYQNFNYRINFYQRNFFNTITKSTSFLQITSLFQNESFSTRYPKKLFYKLYVSISTEFYKWYWAEETYNPKNKKFQRYIFTFKKILSIAYQRNRSITLKSPLKDDLPIKSIIISNKK